MPAQPTRSTPKLPLRARRASVRCRGVRRVTIVLASMLPLAASGCGTAGVGKRTTARARDARPNPPARALRTSHQPYRWLVRVTGPQPSIATENRHSGTAAWRLPGPRRMVGGERYGSVAGYVREQAISPGQIQRIYVSAPGARRVWIRVYRIGWYHGTGGREVLASQALRVVRQPGCTHNIGTGLTECRWHPTLRVKIPPALPTGVYIAKL